MMASRTYNIVDLGADYSRLKMTLGYYKPCSEEDFWDNLDHLACRRGFLGIFHALRSEYFDDNIPNPSELWSVVHNGLLRNISGKVTYIQSGTDGSSLIMIVDERRAFEDEFSRLKEAITKVMGKTYTEIDPEGSSAFARSTGIEALFFKYDCQKLSYINCLEIPAEDAPTLKIWRGYTSLLKVDKVPEVATDSFFSRVVERCFFHSGKDGTIELVKSITTCPIRDHSYMLAMFLWDITVDVWFPRFASVNELKRVLPVQSCEHFLEFESDLGRLGLLTTQLYASLQMKFYPLSNIIFQDPRCCPGTGGGYVHSFGKSSVSCEESVAFWRFLAGYLVSLHSYYRKQHIITEKECSTLHCRIAARVINACKGPQTCPYCAKDWPACDTVDNLLKGTYTKPIDRAHIAPNCWSQPLYWWNFIPTCCNKKQPKRRPKRIYEDIRMQEEEGKDERPEHMLTSLTFPSDQNSIEESHKRCKDIAYSFFVHILGLLHDVKVDLPMALGKESLMCFTFGFFFIDTIINGEAEKKWRFLLLTDEEIQNFTC